MERVMIIGCSGAGKSTLARVLGVKTRIPVVHLDKIWWREGWENISREEFDRLLLAELEQPRWIIDGNYNRTIPQRLSRCDTVIWLDFPRWLCLFGIFRRILTTYGQVRPDMGTGCPERFDWEFLQWVWNFNKTQRPELYNLLNQVENVNVIVLKNRRQVRKFVEKEGYL